MSFLIPENQINIINFNRLIKNLNGLSLEDFIKKISVNFNIQKSQDIIPKNKNEIGVYLQQKSYLIIPKKGSYDEDCVSQLTPSILSKNIFSPILGITDEKTDQNISFISGERPITELKKLVDTGEYAVAFILKPISVKAIKEVADKMKVMPPKSTYIEPKLRSGLTVYPIE